MVGGMSRRYKCVGSPMWDLLMMLFHYVVRLGSAWLGSVWHGSIRAGLRFHGSLVPL